MRPPIWQPPIELSPKESTVVKRIRKAKLFVFLRLIRHELFDSDFQLELAKVFKDSSVGLSPVPPAQLIKMLLFSIGTILSSAAQMVSVCPFMKAVLSTFRNINVLLVPYMLNALPANMVEPFPFTLMNLY